MKTRMIFLLLSLTLFSVVLRANSPSSIDEGKSIFVARCAACHNVNVKLVGPALAGVDQRRSLEWIISFVHSSQSMVKNNDRDAVALFTEFNKIPMPDHPDIKAGQVRSIVDYIKSQAKAKSPVDDAPFAKPSSLQPDYLPISISNLEFFGVYPALVLLLVGVLVLAVRVKELQRKK